MYNPLIDKKPYGATAAGMPTTLRFPLDPSMGIKRVFVVLRQIFGEGGRVEKPPVRSELAYKGREGDEDVFELTFTLSDWGIYNYRFEGELADGALAFFGRGDDGRAIRQDWSPEWQLTVSKCDYKTPNWAKGGVIYQIFADRFCRVGETDFKKAGRLHTYWNERPDVEELGKEYRADDFFGGNIKGIISRLDYLKSLGVTLIYITPIFKSSSNHRYDTSDYLHIDELFGTEEEFVELVKEAKARGMEIMLDGVFNHTGADSVYFNKYGNFDSMGAYQSKLSPYYDWYYFDHYPTVYRCWWGSTVVPTVNKSAQGYRDLILGEGGVIDKWTRLGVKGWRLDVVDELPIDFTTDVCREIKWVDGDCLIIGEVWEDASTKIAYDVWRPYFMGEQLDGVMNYPFKQAILDYTLGGDARRFVCEVTRILENYPRESLDVLMNLLDSHDTIRALTYLSGVVPPDGKLARADFKLDEESYIRARERLFFASTLQYTLPGVPCLYYGDEAGMQGFEDPLNRGTYPWGREDKKLLSHYRALGKMRAQYGELLKGPTTFIEDKELVVFTRRSEMGALTVYANAGDRTCRRKCTGIDAITGRRIKDAVSVAPLSVRVVVSC